MGDSGFPDYMLDPDAVVCVFVPAHILTNHDSLLTSLSISPKIKLHGDMAALRIIQAHDRCGLKVRYS